MNIHYIHKSDVYIAEANKKSETCTTTSYKINRESLRIAASRYFLFKITKNKVEKPVMCFELVLARILDRTVCIQNVAKK